MYICPNCKTESETKINFCPKCGSTMGEIVVTSPAPVVNEQPKAPVIPAQPIVSTYTQPATQYSKAKGIVGMALSIAGLFFAFLAFVYTVALIDLEGALAFGMSIGFTIFSLPLSIVGLVLSKGNANLGDTSTFVKVGKILGLIGVILSGVALFFGFIGLMSEF